MNNIVSRCACVATTLLALTGCDKQPSMEYVNSDGESVVSLAPPPQLISRAVVQEALSPEVRVNGQLVTMAREAFPSLKWSGATTVPEGTDTTVTILWNEDFGPNKLPLASVENKLGIVNSDTSTSVVASDYQFDIHDDDNDGYSNLIERINNTDPYDEFEPGTQVSSVFIPQIDPATAPAIDGAWDQTSWPNGQFVDRFYSQLRINNLMVDQGATQDDQQPGYRWGAMHDDENLYLIIFAEGVMEGQTPFSDSADAFHDDSVDIFIDGDNSKGTSYDGVNDFQMIIPIFETGTLVPNSSSSDNARFEGGVNALPFPTGVEFAACRCDGWSSGQYTLEVKIPLDQVGITVGQPFGIEIQYNDDNDGLTRDAKWGWFHPSKTVNGPPSDYTWQQPKYMGTAQLVTPPSLD